MDILNDSYRIFCETPTSKLWEHESKKVFLKEIKAVNSKDAKKEEYFFQKLYSNFSSYTISGEFLRENDKAFLLMEDARSKGYQNFEYAAPLDFEQIGFAMEALAELHSDRGIEVTQKKSMIKFLSEADAIKDSSTSLSNITILNGRLVDEEGYNYYIKIIDDFLSDFKNKLPEKQKNLFMKLKSELFNAINVDLSESVFVHGDAHPWNFLYSVKKAVLIDWQTWGFGRPTNDLVHLIVMHNFSERRKIIKNRYLLSYVNKVYSGDKEKFEKDYKLSLYRQLLLVLIQKSSEKILPIVWVTNMERVLSELEEVNQDEPH